MKIIGIDDWTFMKAKQISQRDIEVLTDRSDKVVSIVTGTRPYRVELERNNKMISGSCTCPAFANENLCKHIGALWLNLPITFHESCDPHTSYIFHAEEDDWYDEDEKYIFGSFPRRTNTIKDNLELLETSIELEKQNPLESFYTAPLISNSFKNSEEIIYEVSFERGISVEF